MEEHMICKFECATEAKTEQSMEKLLKSFRLLTPFMQGQIIARSEELLLEHIKKAGHQESQRGA